MALLSSVILVSAGADVLRTTQLNRPFLDLCLGFNARGAPVRLSLPREPAPQYLGVREPVGALGSNSYDIAQTLLYECERIHAQGLFADFENALPGIPALCSALDEVFHQKGYPLFVPVSRAQDCRYAVLTLETAISGGSLTGLMQQAMQSYGKARVAALLHPVCADFCLPSGSPEGNPLTVPERLALQEQYHAQVFFSRELCAKYFTYMDAQQRGHFVLFDDDATIENKFICLARTGVPYLFALFPDVAHLL